MSHRTKVMQDPRLSFPVELRLLLECAHQQPDARQVKNIREAAGRVVDWTAFVALTERHRVVPHAYLALSRAASDLAPRSAMNTLSRRFHANTRRNLRIAGELSRMCRAANEAKIPLMCFKGPALAMQIYGGLHCRQFVDVDLLVPPQHIVQAAQLLNGLGYHEQSAPLISLRPRQLRRLIKFHKNVTLTNPNTPGVVVELHWNIADAGQFSIAPQRLWNDAQQLTMGEGSLYVLPPAEQLVFLTWHGGMHRWKRLSWLFDLAQAIRSADNFDATRSLQTAAALGVEKYMKLGLSLARVLIDSEVPATVCSSPSVQRQMELSCRAMLAAPMHFETKPLAATLWAWRMSGKMSLRPEALFQTFAPRVEHIHLNGPRAYLMRWQQLEKRTRNVLLSKLRRADRCKTSSSN